MSHDREMLEDMSALLAKLTELGVVSQSVVSVDNIFVELTEGGRAYFAIVDKFWKEMEITGSEKRIKCIEILLDILVKKEGQGDPPQRHLDL